MLMILARLVRSESFWAVVKVRSPHTGPEVWYPRLEPTPGVSQLRILVLSSSSCVGAVRILVSLGVVSIIYLRVEGALRS